MTKAQEDGLAAINERVLKAYAKSLTAQEEMNLAIKELNWRPDMRRVPGQLFMVERAGFINRMLDKVNEDLAELSDALMRGIDNVRDDPRRDVE